MKGAKGARCKGAKGARGAKGAEGAKCEGRGKSRASRPRRARSRRSGSRSRTSRPPRTPRWNADPDDVRRSVLKLVLTLVELIRQLLERQAIRRMEGGHAVATTETESVGLALMRLQETILELAKQFDISPDELNLDLGPGRQIALSRDRAIARSPIALQSSSGGGPPPAFATSCWLTRSTLNFCALAMILSSVSSKSNDVAFEKRV